MSGKEAVHALRRLSMRFFRLESQPDVNSFNDQDLVLQLDLAHGLRNQALVRCIDLTRFQRAPEGSRKSTGRCRDNASERSADHLRARCASKNSPHLRQFQLITIIRRRESREIMLAFEHRREADHFLRRPRHWM